MRTVATVSVFCMALLFGSPAFAGSSDTSDVACGYSSSGWNAPNGALVLSRTEGGTITPVISTLGEYRTHSMMSHGPGFWATHSTMHTPGTNGWPTYCSRPLRGSELREGYPGISQINQGGIYTNYYAGEHDPVYFRYQIGSSGDNLTDSQNTANWLWSYSDYKYVSSEQGSSGFYQVGIKNSAGDWFDQPYVLYQYKDLQYRNRGWQWTPVYNGAVCSTTIAWAFYKSMSHYGTYSSTKYIESHTYSHTTIVNAGNALYDGAKQSCEDGTGWLMDIGSAITCFESICDDAGRQVRNCMSNSGCCDTDDNDCGWNPLKNDASSTATSVSPDDLGGWSGHDYTGDNVGPWAPYGTAAIEWNSGGNVYGCWF